MGHLSIKDSNTELPDIILNLPDWLKRTFKNQTKAISRLENRVDFIIELSEININKKTGGPFAAGVFEKESGKLVSLGVNIVEKSHCSLAHAEAVAIMAAQKRLGSFDLASKEFPDLELISSAQPCIQCFGNTWWSGIKRLCFAARASDVEEITGFDEGPLPENWASKLENKKVPVEVKQDVLREKALQVLKTYKASGGLVYNPGNN